MCPKVGTGSKPPLAAARSEACGVPGVRQRAGSCQAGAGARGLRLKHVSAESGTNVTGSAGLALLGWPCATASPRAQHSLSAARCLWSRTSAAPGPARLMCSASCPRAISKPVSVALTSPEGMWESGVSAWLLLDKTSGCAGRGWGCSASPAQAPAPARVLTRSVKKFVKTK